MSNSFTFSFGNAPHIFLIFSICVYGIFRKGHFNGLRAIVVCVKKYTIISAFTYKQEKNRKIGFKFRQLLVANVTAFSKISEKEDNLAKYTQIFENFSESFLSTQLCPRNFYNFRLNGSYFGNSTVFGFSGNFSPFAALSKFSKVSVEWKAPFTLGSGSRM